MSSPMTDPLARDHAKLRAAVPAKRRDPVARTLGDIVMRAVAEADELKSQGLDPSAGLEQVVRESWMKPKGRTEPWRYLCEQCEDTGYQRSQCPGDAMCGEKKTDGTPKRIPHDPHAFVRPCWCDKGRQFQVKPKRETDELAAVGKVSKPTRFGRG